MKRPIIAKKKRFTKRFQRPDTTTDEPEIETPDETEDESEGESGADADSTEDADISSSNNEKKVKRVKKKPDIKATLNTIFVGNLPKTLDHHGVAKLFKCCGPVESARIRCIVPEKEKLSPKVALITKRLHPKVDSVNAYVVFKNNENDECIKKALKMNGQKIDGHHIRVDRASMPKAKKETLTSRKKSVFVGNLRFDIRNDELVDHFSKFGTVNHVRLVRDSATGLGKGFGFVVFDERASVKKALELNETHFKGRSLRVKKVEDEQKPKNKKNNNNDNNNNNNNNTNNKSNVNRNDQRRTNKGRDNNYNSNANNYRTRIENKRR